MILFNELSLPFILKYVDVITRFYYKNSNFYTMQYKEEGAAIRQKILLVNIFSGEQERLHQLKGAFFFVPRVHERAKRRLY